MGLIGALGWTMLALARGETVNAIWFVFAGVATYFIGYRFYSKFIENKIAKPNDRRATPAEYKANGSDYVVTDRRVVYGHHFAAIAGAGPLVGPVLAAQWGFLPGTIWIIICAILALVVVNALAESPWGVFLVGLTIPIALFMGVYLRYLRPGKITEVSIIGFVLLMAAIIAGGWVADTSWGQELFTLDKVTLAWGIVIYGFVAAVLPVWLLLAPRDYLSTFMKIGVILLLAAAVILVQPNVLAPALSEFAFTDTAPVVTGSIFPFLFVTIACGALSGFHALISSGTTPKLVHKERQTRMIGYGGMLMESFVALMALVAAVSLDQGIYYAMNASAAATGGTVEGAAEFVMSLGMQGVSVTPEMLTDTAAAVGEESIVSRTGGAPTLALGLAMILKDLVGGEGMMSFWYHFAIMFEALFILTAVDAGTRVARFMLQDTIGNFIPKFGDNSWKPGVWIATAVMVAGWGSILIMGVTDPLGGINTLFPLFGIANQLLAAIALAIVMAIVAARKNFKYLWIVAVPLALTAVITITASLYKIFSPTPSIGYWANHFAYRDALAAGETSLGLAGSVEAMEAVVRNTFVQGTLSIVFVTLSIIVIITAVMAVIKSYKSTEIVDTSDPAVPSRTYAPAGLIATKNERELYKRWLDEQPDLAKGTGH